MSLFLTLLTVCLFSVSDVSAALTDSQSSYQTAFLYFLPDYQPKEQDEAEVRGCAKIGYTVTRANCAAPRILKDKCPVGNSYKTCYCAGSPTCTGSASSSNPYPSSTGASSSSCMNCAGSTLYSWSCSSTTCSSYSLSSCPSNGYCSRCCDGYYKLNSCASGYHVSGNSCAKDCVLMSSETGCSYGTESCSDGCGGTRTCCSACTDTCSSKGYYSSSPSGKTCSTTTVCGSTCYYNCVDTHTHSYSCPSGYSSSNSWGSSAQTASKTCSCGATSGTCYKAPSDPCYGVTCPSGQSCSNGECISTCVSGGSSSCSGQTSACSSSQVQTSSCTDCGGVTHYSCREKTCAEQGKKDCNGSCIATSSCCSDSDCSSGQKCQSGSCVSTCTRTCATAITTKPANSSYTTCTDCSGTYNTGWSCNSGYTKSGSSCIQNTPTCSDSGYYGGTSCSNWSSADCMEDYGRMGTSAACNPILTNGTCSYCAYDSNPSACYGRCLGSCDVDSWRRCCEQCNGGI